MNHLHPLINTSYIFSSTCPACITGRLPYAAKLGLHAIYTDFYIRFHRSVACLVNEIHFLAWGSSLSQLSWPNVGGVARLTELQYLLLKHYPKSLLLCNPSITSLISDTPLVQKSVCSPSCCQKAHYLASHLPEHDTFKTQDMMTWCWVVVVSKDLILLLLLLFVEPGMKS